METIYDKHYNKILDACKIIVDSNNNVRIYGSIELHSNDLINIVEDFKKNHQDLDEDELIVEITILAENY